MNRPERMNSMAFELMVPLAEAFDQVDEDNDTTCVILTGNGAGFCSGADHPRHHATAQHRRHDI